MVKRQIISLYEEDFKKIDASGRKLIVETVLSDAFFDTCIKRRFF